MSAATEDVRPQTMTNGAPPSTPIAWTAMRPRTERRRHQSASQPPAGAPTLLGAWAENVAVHPALAKPIWNGCEKNFGIHEDSTTATKVPHMNTASRTQRGGVASARRPKASR